MRYSIETRANLPEFYKDEEDRRKKLEVMENSQFHKLLSIKVHTYTSCLTLIKALMEVYDLKSRKFRLGQTLCSVLDQEVAYLLGIRNSGSIYNEASLRESACHQIPDFFAKLLHILCPPNFDP